MSPASIEQVLALVDGVDGWMTAGQAATLHEAATGCPAGGVIVEIGSFRGRSTIVLASAAPPDAEVIAIDPHAGNDRGPQELVGFGDEADNDHEVFLANLDAAGVGHRVRHLRMFSETARAEIDAPIDVLYIDGAHRYGPARADIDGYGAMVTEGGTMLIHDSFSSIGVTTAILRQLLFGRRFRYVGRSRSLAIYRADLPGGFATRTANAARQTAQLPWFVRNVALKVLLTLGLGRAYAALGRPTPGWPY